MPNPTNRTDAMANKSLLKYISGVGTKIIQTSIMVAIIKILNNIGMHMSPTIFLLYRLS